MKNKNIFISLILSIIVLLTLTSCDHEHEFSNTYESDATHHWLKCTVEGCNKIKEKKEHTFDEGKIIKTDLEHDKVTKKYTCTVCKKTRDLETLFTPKTDVNEAEWKASFEKIDNFSLTGEQTVSEGKLQIFVFADKDQALRKYTLGDKFEIGYVFTENNKFYEVEFEQNAWDRNQITKSSYDDFFRYLKTSFWIIEGLTQYLQDSFSKFSYENKKYIAKNISVNDYYTFDKIEIEFKENKLFSIKFYGDKQNDFNLLEITKIGTTKVLKPEIPEDYEVTKEEFTRLKFINNYYVKGKAGQETFNIKAQGLFGGSKKSVIREIIQNGEKNTQLITEQNDDFAEYKLIDNKWVFVNFIDYYEFQVASLKEILNIASENYNNFTLVGKIYKGTITIDKHVINLEIQFDCSNPSYIKVYDETLIAEFTDINCYSALYMMIFSYFLIIII